MALSKEQIKHIFNGPYQMQWVRKASETEQVVEELRTQAINPDVCVAVAMYSPYADSILRGLKARFEGALEYSRFISALVSIPPEFIGSKLPITWDLVRDLLSNVAALSIIVERGEVDPNNPIQKRLDWDPYWESKFLRHLKRANFKRAWDTAKQARLGFFLPDTLPEGTSVIDFDGCQSEEFRAFPASRPLLGSMVRRLFDAMVTNGVISPLNPEDPAPDWDSLHTRVPGIMVAWVLYEPEDHKALIIGAHFSKTTNAKKRAKLMREIARA